MDFGESTPKNRTLSNSRPGHDPARDKSHSRAVLQYFRELPKNLPDRECPSSLELICYGRFGQRPVNRINNLKNGNFDGHRYDFEKMCFGRGEFRWRLHEPARPGYPKNEKQTVLHLDAPVSSFSAGKPPKSWEQVCAERDAKMSQPEPSFELRP